MSFNMHGWSFWSSLYELYRAIVLSFGIMKDCERLLSKVGWIYRYIYEEIDTEIPIIVILNDLQYGLVLNKLFVGSHIMKCKRN